MRSTQQNHEDASLKAKQMMLLLMPDEMVYVIQCLKYRGEQTFTMIENSLHGNLSME